MMHVGDIISTLGDFGTSGAYHDAWGSKLIKAFKFPLKTSMYS